ncbi:DUF742 domain-containing protein [Streptomyces sp. NPDC048411]|uniref:DUF742 domain-containing protein n=1 Tax=Streptomyces sp. NPDC048411 TaxID=3157206 RepID=UPI00345575D3
MTNEGPGFIEVFPDPPDLPGSQWYDAEAGPLVRPYAMTGGRTEPGPGGVHFDLIALVSAVDQAPDSSEDSQLGPEHRALLTLCRSESQSVAELSADADLPVGGVRGHRRALREGGPGPGSRPETPAAQGGGT